MFWAKLRVRLAAAMLSGGLLAAAVSAEAGVVVKSSGPTASRYPVGTKLDDNATITLRDGDAVTVLTADGTRVIRGAGTHRVGDRPKVANDRFAALTRKRAANRVRTGAVRAEVDEAPTNPSLWYVDVTRSGVICLYDLGAVRLWRPGPAGTSTYRVADAGGTNSVEVTFDDTVVIAALDPARLPITEGAAYRVYRPDGSLSAELRFAAIAEDFGTPDALAEMLIAKGCSVQVDALANSLEAAAAAAAVEGAG